METVRVSVAQTTDGTSNQQRQFMIDYRKSPTEKFISKSSIHTGSCLSERFTAEPYQAVALYPKYNASISVKRIRSLKSINPGYQSICYPKITSFLHLCRGAGLSFLFDLNPMKQSIIYFIDREIVPSISVKLASNHYTFYILF
jgi:hypothetical protein